MRHLYDRYESVLKYIDAHLHETLDTKTLSKIAHLSKFHFHRQFYALYGINLFAYIQAARIKKASYQLAFRHKSVLEIALENGYNSSEAFSRAFSRSLKQSPRHFRKQPDWLSWHQHNQQLSYHRNQTMQTIQSNIDVQIVHFDETLVATMTHHGAPSTLGKTIQAFIQWRRQNNLSPSKSRTFNLVYNDPETTEPEKYHIDLCVSVTSQNQYQHNEAIIYKIIPTGPCAYIRYRGSDENLRELTDYLYTDWLKNNQEELRDFPLFFERIRFYPDVPESKAITDIYLPLKD